MLNKKRSKLPAYKVLVVGAGRIGAFFDTPKTKNILTHAHAFTKNHRTELVGFVDANKKQAESAARVWGGRSFADLKTALETVRPDIVSVCVPDKHHLSVLKELLIYRPKLVICEKPLTLSLSDSVSIRTEFTKNKIPILVNYSRRFSGTFRKLKTDIEQEKYGKVLSVVGTYTKGIMHNGTHLLDVAGFLFGKAKLNRTLFARSDYENHDDKTVGGFVTFERCPQFYLSAADERSYSVFELDIMLERARFRVIDADGTLISQFVVNDPNFDGYKILSKTKTTKADLFNMMYNMSVNAVEFLDGKSEILCTADDAITAQKLALKLLNNK